MPAAVREHPTFPLRIRSATAMAVGDYPNGDTSADQVIENLDQLVNIQLTIQTGK